MDVYTSASFLAAKELTNTFSTSFSVASRFFNSRTRTHIYSIYAFVRVADEIVDTYQGKDMRMLLDAFEQETYQSLKRGFSSNPVIHAFVVTAHTIHINETLIKPFFKSMRMDIAKKSYSQKEYEEYIYGSAEVVGLMCLKAFVDGNEKQYTQLSKGAQALGSAYQKVNFLRDIKDDFDTRKRYYFPTMSFEAFDDKVKNEIIKDIENDFNVARASLVKLPRDARRAVTIATVYYEALLVKLASTPASLLVKKRVRISNSHKFLLLFMVLIKVKK